MSRTHPGAHRAARHALPGSMLERPGIERKAASEDLGDTAAEIKKAVAEFMAGHEEFKKANDERLKQLEKKGTADPTTLAKLAKIEIDLAKGEEISAKLVKLEQERKAELDRLDQIEKKLARPPAPAGVTDVLELKANVKLWGRAVYGAYTFGAVNLPEDQQKALADVLEGYKSLGISNDTGGGYLAPAGFVPEIIKGVTEISPARSIVRVRQTVNKSLEQPSRNGQFAAQWVADQGTRSETTGLAYGMKEIPTHEMFALVDISRQNLDDSAFDLEAEIREEASEQFALAEGTSLVTGNGVGRPEGWMSNSGVGTTNSGAATAVTADGLLTLKHAIKTAYAANATFVMNRTTLGSIRKLKDGTGQYLWMPGIAQGKPNTIDGDPYVEMPDMPSEGAGLKPVAYGDFRRAYTLIDRTVMSMLRDPYTQATSGNMRFMFFRRLGGQVMLAEAIRTLTCST